MGRAAAARSGLTDRELEVLGLLAQGEPVKTIAHQLEISVNTCRGHVHAILEKFFNKHYEFYGRSLDIKYYSTKSADDASLRAKVVTTVTVALWVGVIYFGRMMPFIGNSF